MNGILSLPSDLQSVIGTEKVEFSLLAKRSEPRSKSLGMLAFGIAWTLFTGIFVIAFFGPVIKGEEVNFETNGQATTGSWDNFEPLLVPALIIGLFVLIGIGMISWGIYASFRKGGYYVGTANRLIRYQNGNINSYDWEQFSGNVELNVKNGDLSLELRTGKMESRKNNSNTLVPDVVYISGADDILEIEKICRKRIKENDPTPAKLTPGGFR